ncbi:MAG: DUF3800 domain-containing protein [Ancrocorticia sp.]|uniref:DUF3800 domain-containing protein n=1 Tax=Ancrocorticia sp. TaxID=2593684 RepID=UPI003F8FA71E
MFIDESGSKSSHSKFFVLGLVKVRDSGQLMRELRGVRERHHFKGEFKFSAVTRDTKQVYFEAIEQLAQADVRIGAYVFDKATADPFQGRQAWEAQRECVSKLVRGNTNRGELLSAHLDLITTPSGVSLADQVKSQVNQQLQCMTVVSCLDLDSRSTDGLQMADLVAGSVSYARRAWSGESPDLPGQRSDKGELAQRLRRCFDLESFDDTTLRSGRVNIRTAGFGC